MGQIISIDILGEEFKFKVEEDNHIDANEIAAYLSEQVDQVASKFPVHARKTNKLTIVVMAALNIAKQHVELDLRHGKFMQSVSNRTAVIEQLIASSSCG